MDWVWSALHLRDGTHLHGVDLRIPGAPPIGVGYIQPPGGPLVELQAVSARESFGDNGLPLTTTLALSPGDVTATVDIKGHAPVLLDRRRRPGEPVPARVGDCHHGGRPHRRRLARVEPTNANRDARAYRDTAWRHRRVTCECIAAVTPIGDWTAR